MRALFGTQALPPVPVSHLPSLSHTSRPCLTHRYCAGAPASETAQSPRGDVGLNARLLPPPLQTRSRARVP
eukprot:366569-Chlamydomonas_euryale.AAC.40